MRILVCPHQMGMGGSQLTAIELAAAMGGHGHRVSIFAPAGVLVDRARTLGLELITAPDPRRGREWVRKLITVIGQQHIDLVHGYEWRPCLDAAFGAGVLRRTPVLMSVLSMAVPAFLPRGLPIVVGTPALATRQHSLGRRTFLIEPSVDMITNQSRDVVAARARWGVRSDELVISTVSMLTTELEKLQGVLALIAVVDRLSADYPIRLLIAGDGEGFEQVCRRAQQVNQRHGREIVRPLGFLPDPEPVYEAADVAIGMGTSAIKAMAHGKPLIVQGEAGFWQSLRPDNSERFLHAGWFGAGGAGVRDLEGALRPLLGDAGLRTELGRFGRELVGYRYSTGRASRRLAGVYAEVGSNRLRLRRMAPSLARSAVDVTRYRLAERMGDVVKHETASREGMVNP
ncbi:glycosyltransferase family 4 protein [Microlunatus elymi]|uniref:Glycosyltransferase family 4 protein n=1 Tax=Microlunatus elymi TaxID=2596828 RepID=A0A516PUG1_9ACTN|nr:glycosyltransferase family 4 protein [Microlunatus elymi]QDP94601.1 glycosyltransferase family 4 protein [Microlunatus elymi]